MGRRVRFGAVILVGVVLVGAGIGVAIAGNLGAGIPLALMGLAVVLFGYLRPPLPTGDRSKP